MRMLEKLNRILSIILIIIVVGVAALSVLLGIPRMMPVLPITPTTEKSSAVQENTEIPADEQVLEMLSTFFSADELATPENQQLIEVIRSPAYEAFLATKPTGIGDILDFFQSQSIPIDKTQVFRQFSEYTTTTSERDMRAQLSQLFLDTYIEMETETGAAAFEDVIAEFLSEQDNLSWMMTHFEGDFMKFGEWTTDVLRNPTSPREETSAVVNSNTTSQPTHNARDTDEIDKTPSIEVGDETLTEDAPHIDVESLEVLTPEVPELPSEENLETALHEQFSPERFSRAMNMLNQYGPEEGLRRLKDSDPEVAKQVARLLPKQLW